MGRKGEHLTPRTCRLEGKKRGGGDGFNRCDQQRSLRGRGRRNKNNGYDEKKGRENEEGTEGKKKTTRKGERFRLSKKGEFPFLDRVGEDCRGGRGVSSPTATDFGKSKKTSLGNRET